MTIRFLNETDDCSELMSVRYRVFIEEQGFDPTLERDRYDGHCVYAELRNERNECVGTGRLFLEPTGHWVIGRLCLLPEYRGRGLGGQLLSALVARAETTGAAEVWLHSQADKTGFYAKYGFVPVGEIDWEDEGRPHQHMKRVF